MDEKGNRNRVNKKVVFSIIGATIAFGIGSGFATGQEIMQYYASYGWWGLGTAVIFMAVTIYTIFSYSAAGHYQQFEKNYMIFDYYCGPIIGRLFDYFAAFFCYMSFAVMASGASALLNEQWGVPNYVGGVAIVVLACAAVLFGLNGVINVIGKIGPVMIVFSIFIAIVTLVTNYDSIPENIAKMESGEVEVMQAGSNWFMAGLSYGDFVLLWFASFVTQLAKEHSLKEVYTGVCCGQLITNSCGVILAFALISCITEVAGTQIPNLVLAVKIAPWLSAVFALIIFIAVLSSAAPLLWTTAQRMAPEKTPRYRIITIVLSVIGLIIAFFIPFNRLMNICYVINGYGGFILVIFMIVKDVKTYVIRKEHKK